MENLLEVRGLKTHFKTDRGLFRAVDGISFGVPRGRTVGLVGESGCGKSVTSLSVMGLVPSPPGKVEADAVMFAGRDVLGLSADERRRLRGGKMSMIFQEPMTSLNPVHTVGQQIVEAILAHTTMSPQAARARAIEMLELVRIPSARQRIDDFPHSLSGGMRQRVMIAMALSCEPALLIADEPTTALDVTIQAQILDLLSDLQRRLGMAILIITHDLGVIAEVADQVLVMYAGQIVESADVADLFADPQHPYTIGLLGSIPRLDVERERLATIEGTVPSPNNQPKGCRFAPRCPFADRPLPAGAAAVSRALARPVVACWKAPVGVGGMSATPVLKVDGLVKHFQLSRGIILRRQIGLVRAVEDVSFEIARGETLALVGKSGCGKSTTGRLVLRLMDPTAGSVPLQGRGNRKSRQGRIAAAAPAHADHFSGPLRLAQSAHDGGRDPGRAACACTRSATPPRARRAVRELLEIVGLLPEHARRYPHQFSGGQRQRIGIARALAVNPELIICDEPVSALDVSIQAQIVNLLQNLQQRFGLSYLFIAHDLAVVKHISDRVAVMYLGKLVEIADKKTIYAKPLHPYTHALLSAIPKPDPTPARQAHHAAGRRAEPVQSADRLPFPHPLPVRPGALLGGRAETARGRARPSRRLSFLRNIAAPPIVARRRLRAASSLERLAAFEAAKKTGRWPDRQFHFVRK